MSTIDRTAAPSRNHAAAGLPAPSTVRFKLLTLDHRLVRGELGRLAPADEQAVNHALLQLPGTYDTASTPQGG